MCKKISAVLICFVILFSFVSCGFADENSDEADTNKVFEVGKTLYECDKFELSCVKISSDGIEFNCKNKTDEEIKIHLTVALDGTVASLSSEASETTIAPNKSQAFYMHSSLKTAEHKLMSVNGTAFIDSGNVTFDVCDFDLGGKENKENLAKGETYYSTKDLVVAYIGATAQGLDFKVINSRGKSITFGADSLKINGESEDYDINTTTIPAHSQGVYSIDILSHNENYFSNQLTSFECVLEASIDGKGVVDRFPVSYNKDEDTTNNKEEDTATEETTNKVESTTADKATEGLSYVSAARLFESELENFYELIYDLNNNLDYYENNDFTELEIVKTYESIWKNMSDDAKSIYINLTMEAPPELYEDIWYDFAECMEELSNILAKGTNLDTNNDDEYTDDEIVDVITDIGNAFVEISKEAIALAEELGTLSEQVAETEDESETETESETTKAYSTKSCLICGKQASYSYSVTSSGTTEYYCTEHYELFQSLLN